jgi:hypothetical protein
MSDLGIGLRGVAAAAIAILTSFFLVGTAGLNVFWTESPWIGLGLPLWVAATAGLAELALAGALWLPYLHRIAGLLVAADAVIQWLANRAAGNPGAARMNVVVGVLGLAVAALWTSRRVEARSAAWA